jgi:predicted rRNA methylase YqxC with S4 and FtsJ domains
LRRMIDIKAAVIETESEAQQVFMAEHRDRCLKQYAEKGYFKLQKCLHRFTIMLIHEEAMELEKQLDRDRFLKQYAEKGYFKLQKCLHRFTSMHAVTKVRCSRYMFV